MTPQNMRRRRRIFISIAVLVFTAVLGGLVLQKYAGRHQTAAPFPSTESGGSITVTLFFADQDGTRLAREMREVDRCTDLPDCIDTLVGELANGPIGELTPTLPPNTVTRNVRMEGDTAVVDLGNEIVEGLPGGSNSETMAIYAITNTICYNFPRIKRVRFLLEGREAETLKGHIDLREPLEPDYRLEKAANK